MMSEEIGTNSPTHYEIRHTVVVLVVQLLLAELVITLLHIIIDEIILAHRFHDMYFAGLSGKTWELFFFHLLTTIAIIYFVLRWVSSYYIISKEEIAYEHGIISKKRNAYNIAGIQEIDTSQSVWGRLFGYGNIVIENPFISGKIYINKIPRPDTYAKIIQSIHNAESKKYQEKIIPERRQDRQ